MLFCVFRTIVIYAAVIAALRIMGKRQLGELQPSELVTTFLISSVASLCIDDPDLPLASSLVPIFLLSALEIINSYLACRFPHYAAILFGRPVTVIRNGEILPGALTNLRLSPSDLLESLRGKDCFSPSEIAWGVVEANGSLSIVRNPGQDSLEIMLPVLVNGISDKENLSALHLSETDLDSMLAARNLNRKDVLLYLYSEKQSYLLQKAQKEKGHPHKGGPEEKHMNRSCLTIALLLVLAVFLFWAACTVNRTTYALNAEIIHAYALAQQQDFTAAQKVYQQIATDAQQTSALLTLLLRRSSADALVQTLTALPYYANADSFDTLGAESAHAIAQLKQLRASFFGCF